MTRTTWVKLAVTAFLLAATVSAVAAEGAVNIAVLSPVQLNGKQIAAGNYKVVWTGKDNNVQVTFKAGKTEVATAAAKLVEQPTASAYTAVVRDKDGKLVEIRVAGKKSALVFAE